MGADEVCELVKWWTSGAKEVEWVMGEIRGWEEMVVVMDQYSTPEKRPGATHTRIGGE